jgi:hypothetical protein
MRRKRTICNDKFLDVLICEAFLDKIQKGLQSSLNKYYTRKHRVNPTTYTYKNSIVMAIETPSGRKCFKVNISPASKLTYPNEL